MCGRGEDRQTETARNRKWRRGRQTEQRVGGAERETHKDKADRKLAGTVRKGQRDRHSEQRKSDRQTET